MDNTINYILDGEVIDQVSLHKNYVEECRESGISMSFDSYINICGAIRI